MMPRQVTGRHVLLWMVLFFGVVVAANLTMAFFATASWTGLVVKNSYVASQHFNEDLDRAEAQKALGWQHDFSFNGQQIIFTLKDRDGRLVPLESVTIHAGHPAAEFQDRVIDLAKVVGGPYQASNDLPPGEWNLEIRAMAKDGTEWKVRYRSTIQEKDAKG